MSLVEHKNSIAESSEGQPDKKRVVYLCSNPTKGLNGEHLSNSHPELISEMRAFEQAMQEGGDSSALTKANASIDDLFKAIDIHDPETLVISGEAEVAGIMLQDQKGCMQPLGTFGLVGLLHRGTRLKYLFLNSCNTVEIGRAILKELPNVQVICWASKVRTTAALSFARGVFNTIKDLEDASFYDAYLAGLKNFIRDGFQIGDPQLGMESDGVMAFEQFISGEENATNDDLLYKVQIKTYTGRCITLHVSGACLDENATVSKLTEKATEVAKKSMSEVQRIGGLITMQGGAVVGHEEAVRNAIDPRVPVEINIFA